MGFVRHSFESSRLRAPTLALLAGAAASPTLSAQPVVFEDVAEAAGVAVRFTLPAGSSVTPYISGAAAGDFDRDGWQDLFVLGGGGAPDHLFLNNRDGTFTDHAADWGVDAPHIGSGAAVADFNGDGWPDLYVTSFGPDGQTPGAHKLYRNEGGSGFTDVAESAGVNLTSVNGADGYSAAFGDFDLDGDLELFVTGWSSPQTGNRLFRNDGAEHFSDVTAEALGPSVRTARGFTPRFVDMNGDGYPELLLAADYGESRYFANRGDGTFADETAAAGVGLESNGMGQAVGDFDGDGQPDWYVTSIHNTALPEQFGNALYRNLGAHRYEEIGASAGVNEGGWGWGAVAADLDLDGDLDLGATNGWFSIQWANIPTRIFRNDGALSFTEVGAEWGVDDAGLGRGMLAFDYDNDGDQDLVVASLDLPLRLYRNSASESGHWLRVFLDTQARPDLAPDGIGAVVEARAGSAAQFRTIDGGSNYLSQSECSAHFGLASADAVEELRIRWSDGHVSVYRDLPADRTLRLAADPDADLDGDGDVDLADLSILLMHFEQPAPGGHDDGDLSGDGAVSLADLLQLLSEYGTPAARSLD